MLAFARLLLVPAPLVLALQGQPAPSPGKVHSSPDNRFQWVEGEDFVLVTDSRGKKPRRVPLPAEAKPASRQILFAEKGRYFCLLDARDNEFGLHLDVRRGPREAMALLMSSTLRLLDDAGRVLWSRDMPQKVAVSGAGAAATARPGSPERAAARSLRISNDGTLAILLQDVDPYDKARPLLLVINPMGKELLRLDYTSWAKVDEFVLSNDGRFVALRGFGHIPQEDSWGKAVGLYATTSDKKWLRPIRSSPDEPLLRTVDSEGWACCLREGGRFLAFGKDGQSETLSASALERRFGITP